jgi:peptidoglycan/xylan/chitin deacetylase (PgdA/CDA1 family)
VIHRAVASGHTAAASSAVAGAAVLVHTAPALLSVWSRRSGRSAPLAGRGDPKRVALTFDDGPNPASTPHFIETLARYRVHATFFVLGCMAARSPALCRSLVTAGHEVAVHGWTHRNLLLRGPLATYRDLAGTRALLTDLTGQVPRYFRPPYGVFSTPALLAARYLGLTPVLWTCWGKDWTASATPRTVVNTLLPGLTGGATVLLHDSDGGPAPDAWRSTLAALPQLLDECARRGLRVGPLRDHGARARS